MNAAELAELLRGDVATALSRTNTRARDRELRQIAADAFAMAYDDISDEPTEGTAAFVASIENAISLTEPDGSEEQVDRVTAMVSVAASNAAVLSATPPGTPMRWVTMEDDRVRDLHTPLHGEVQAAGQPFLVGGVPLLYPGQPIGPPEVWINCRCTLQPSTLSAAAVPAAVDAPAPSASVAGLARPSALVAEDDPELVARAFDSAKRKQMAKRHTAMPDGSFPIANAEDLRNAIQAIGRAKDPAKARAHIRRRAKALGLTSLIPDSWTASAEEDEATDKEEAGLLAAPVEGETFLEGWPKSSSPPGTHDAPGWLTHPRETQRLRNYWVKGPGAAKIGWGSPGDLTRCAKNLRKYVGPHAWGTCQNMHKEALGIWNPESGGRKSDASLEATAEDDTSPETLAMIDAAFAAANELEESPMLLYPKEWFDDPGFDAPTPLTITSDGRVLGHLATWDTCHVGITGECVTPPRSNTSYAHFRTGEVETREGELVAVGQITMDTGHAGKDVGPAETVSHYDNTGTGVADVNAGEDQWGIWVAGAMRPGVSEHQVYVLKATGALSGDWRRIGGNLELVAALAVNVPGFPIPRVEMAASAGRTMSLVAAAIVATDPNSMSEDRMVLAVQRALDEREAAQQRAQRAAAVTATGRQLRAERLMAAIPDNFKKGATGKDEKPDCGKRRDDESDKAYEARMAKCEKAEDDRPPWLKEKASASR